MKLLGLIRRFIRDTGNGKERRQDVVALRVFSDKYQSIEYITRRALTLHVETGYHSSAQSTTQIATDISHVIYTSHQQKYVALAYSM